MRKDENIGGNVLFRHKKILSSFIFVLFFSVFLSFSVPSVMKYRNAEATPVVIDIPCDCTFCIVCGPCPTLGSTDLVQAAISFALDAIQEAVEKAIEEFIRNIVDSVFGSFLTNLNDAEENLMDWWQQLWEYDMRPAFQSMTAQLHTARVDQTRNLGSAYDGQNFTFVQNQLKSKEVEASYNFMPSESVCMAATQAAGFSRANTFVRAVRFGMEDEKHSRGLNRLGTINVDGIEAVHNQNWNNHVNVLCNEQSNRGNTCLVSGTRPDADILPTATLLNPLTIDLKDIDTLVATNTAMDNIAGVDVIPPVRPGAVDTTAGQRMILQARERLAKRAAARSPQMLSAFGWRSRGSDMAAWVNEFNLKTGSKIVVSNDPSYYEVMNAITKYKFLSGSYGKEQVNSDINIEREKLISSSLYLMHLRDYYELLERVVLAAAVDASIELDKYGKIDNSLSSVSKR